MPNTDIRISLQNFFTSLDLYNLWRVNNVREYLEKGPTPLNDGLNYFIATPLLKDFLSTANNAVQEGGVSGDFRFAHAETIIPFAALIGIPKASKEINNISKIQDEWLDFDIAPMAANIQWIFYSNSEGNVIVKMMLNEIEVDFPVKTDIHPYYYWDDVYIYYNNLLDKIENNG